MQVPVVLLCLHAARALVAPPRITLKPRLYAKKGVFGPVDADVKYMPQAKETPQRQVGLWPRSTASTFFRVTVVVWTAVFALTLASATMTVPGVAEAAGGAVSRSRVVADGLVAPKRHDPGM